MKKLAIRLSLFVIILLVYFGTNLLINKFFISISNLGLKDTNILIVGDSHTEKSLNPVYFQSASNISQPAEPYLLTYWKLKYVLDQIKVDTVVLGFSHHNISAFNDRKFSDNKWSSEMFKRIYSIPNFQGLIKYAHLNNVQFYKTYFHNMCFYPKKQHINFIGKYSNMEHNDISDYTTAIDRHYYYENKDVGISEGSISYLDSIKHICQQHGTTLVLVASPVHQSYYDRIPAYIIDRYNQEKELLQKQGVIVIDYSHYFYEDEYFLNSDHLNNKGAKRFTNELKDLFHQDTKI